MIMKLKVNRMIINQERLGLTKCMVFPTLRRRVMHG